MTVTARRNRLLVAVLVALTMTAGIFGAAVLTARAAQADPVYLEPASAAGADPFVPSLLQPQEGAAAVPEMAGTGDQGTCDPATLTAYLNGHPDAAAAWVKALDADPGLSWSGGNQVTVEQISAYVGELTPAVLGGDMQVTNHRFVDGQLAAVQSVLQEGTAVLVDADGTPRVRCACGNPLTPAADSDDESSETEYVGEPWDGFTYEDSDTRTRRPPTTRTATAPTTPSSTASAASTATATTACATARAAATATTTAAAGRRSTTATATSTSGASRGRDAPRRRSRTPRSRRPRPPNGTARRAARTAPTATGPVRPRSTARRRARARRALPNAGTARRRRRCRARSARPARPIRPPARCR